MSVLRSRFVLRGLVILLVSGSAAACSLSHNIDVPGIDSPDSDASDGGSDIGVDDAGSDYDGAAGEGGAGGAGGAPGDCFCALRRVN